MRQAASARRCFQPPESWPGELLLASGQAKAFDGFAHGPAPVRHAVHARDEIEVFGDGQILPEAEPLGHVADLAFDRLALGHHVVAEAGALARRRRASRPHSMRMNVVLPLPLGPRKPKISPVADLERDVVDDHALAEALGHAAHVDGELSRSVARVHGRSTSTGWPGCRRRATAGSKRTSIMKTSLPRLSWL